MNDQLHDLQKTELEILSTIDAFCRKHDIKYTLYAGTLLGAVRHKGFIPWDDDIDICMRRGDYNRFIYTWNKEQPAGYILQNKENTPTFSQSFTKIRKDHTTFVQKGEPVGEYHMGVFVDVFPIDRMPSGKLNRLYFYWNCMQYQLLTREYVPPQSNVIVKLGSYAILAMHPKDKRTAYRNKLLEKITRNDEEKSLNTVATEIMETMTIAMPADLMDEYTELEFEGKKFMCVKNWDAFLKLEYGDYMKLPPKEEQTWRHFPLILNLEKNLEEL